MSIGVSLEYGNFPIRFIGNYLTIDEYENLTLCDSKICLIDADTLIENASYNKSVLPCDDFNEFCCGTFLQDRALNERYESIGLKRELEVKNDEKMHRVLKQAVNEKDGKAVKIIKNFYQNCINWSELQFVWSILLKFLLITLFFFRIR